MSSGLVPSRGFTLIELLVVIAIIGILSSVVLTSLASGRAQARDGTRMAEVHEIKSALELYLLDNGSYPLAAAPTDIFSALGPALQPVYIKTLTFDTTNVSGATYYRPASTPESYLIYVSLEKQLAPGVYGCRTGVGPQVNSGLYPGTPECTK